MRDGVTVTYSVCIGGAGIDYCSVTGILYTYSVFITLRFYASGLGLRWPSSWARLAQVSATRQRYRCHRFGTLLRWGFRFLSRIRLRCFDYSRFTNLRDAYIPVTVHLLLVPFFASCYVTRSTSSKCFGLSTALPVITWVMAPVSAILHSLGICMRRYLDTWLVQSSSQESLLEVLLPVLRLCLVFGIVIPPRYSNLIPSQVVQCLWVVFDSASFRASPSVERISRRQSATAVFMSCA